MIMIYNKDPVISSHNLYMIRRNVQQKKRFHEKEDSALKRLINMIFQ